MGTTAFNILGQQLKDFLVKQFAPPPGASTTLGFLGTGVAVDASSFLSDGQFNPARVNQWLDIVVDPLGTVVQNGDQVEFVPWTATQLLEAIYSQAMSTAPADSDTQHGFAKAKSMALEGMGGASTVTTAPLDWYDPAQVAHWPGCALTASTSESSSSGTPPPPPVAKPLWAWRSIDRVPMQVATPPAHIDFTPAAGVGTRNVLDHRRMMFASASIASAAPSMQVRMATLPAATVFAQTTQVSDVATAARFSVDRAPTAMIRERALSPSEVLMVSQAVSTAANQASSSSVASNSLSLRLKYQVVSLSRAPWWNEFLLTLENWYVPGCHKGSLLQGGEGQKTTGVPIAMVLTSDVNIQAVWSAEDRAAATTNTHFGPWALNSAQFTATSNAGEAILAIPGVTAIACIYRQLPALPPQSDPGLAPSPTT